MKYLVSACLLGRNCKYNGSNNRSESIIAYLQDKEVIEVCPEALAGLGIPRTPIEIVGSTLLDRDGNCVDGPVRKAVAQILEQIQGDEVTCILKSRSPTCGVKQVYDGTFSGTLKNGSGVLAQALIDAGYRVIDAEDIP